MSLQASRRCASTHPLTDHSTLVRYGYGTIWHNSFASISPRQFFSPLSSLGLGFNTTSSLKMNLTSTYLLIPQKSAQNQHFASQCMEVGLGSFISDSPPQQLVGSYLFPRWPSRYAASLGFLCFNTGFFCIQPTILSCGNAVAAGQAQSCSSQHALCDVARCKQPSSPPTATGLYFSVAYSGLMNNSLAYRISRFCTPLLSNKSRFFLSAGYMYTRK